MVYPVRKYHEILVKIRGFLSVQTMHKRFLRIKKKKIEALPEFKNLTDFLSKIQLFP